MTATPSGFTVEADYPAMPGVAPDDMSAFGRALAAILPKATRYFDPDYANLTVAGAAPAALYDRASRGTWSAVTSGGAPAAATINGKEAVTCDVTARNGFRAKKQDVTGSFSVVGVFELTAAAIAINNPRFLLYKNGGAPAIDGPNGAGILVGGGDTFNVRLPGATAFMEKVFGGLQAGIYVHGVSADAVTGELRVFLNNATVPWGSAAYGAAAGAVNGFWCLGFDGRLPGGAAPWQDKIGRTVVVDNSPLHGTAALDKTRIRAMRLVADYYGVTLSG